MSYWEPFTEAGRRAMVLAQEAAQRLGNSYIGSDHIFLGVLETGDNAAADAVWSFGVTLEDARRKADAIIGHGGTVSQEMVFTPDAKRVIEAAFEEARTLQHHWIGAEHLVLGYLRSDDSSKMLAALDLNRQNLRAKILELLPETAARHAAGPSSLDLLFTVRISKPIPELWTGLRAAAEIGDADAAFCNAFFIAQKSGWTSTQAAAKLQEFIRTKG